jgi:hypothetical protein
MSEVTKPEDPSLRHGRRWTVCCLAVLIGLGAVELAEWSFHRSPFSVPAAPPERTSPADVDISPANRDALGLAIVRILPDAGGVLFDHQRRLVATVTSAVGNRDHVDVEFLSAGSSLKQTAAVVYRDQLRGLVWLQLPTLPQHGVALAEAGKGFEVGHVLGVICWDHGEPFWFPNTSFQWDCIERIYQPPHLCGTVGPIVPWSVALLGHGPFGEVGAPVIDQEGRLLGVEVSPGPGRAQFIDVPAMHASLEDWARTRR